jgi:hypothetical protein
MSMKERLKIHRQIEAENRENIEAAAAWDSCTVSEIREMIEEKDRGMEWDEHFAFQIQLLNRKLHYAELGI